MAAPLRIMLLTTRTTVFSRSLPGLQTHCLSVVSLNNAWGMASICQPMPYPCSHTQNRHSSFFKHVTASDLWQGVVSVSNAGKKRGRGKRVGRKRVTDLNRGQVMGTGQANILWPGLNSPIIKGKDVLQQKQLPPNPDREKELVRMRDEMSHRRKKSLPPLLRGWSGNRYPGQSIGCPDPVADYQFTDFDTKVLEFKMVANMTGTLGRKMRFSAFVVTGNKNGLAGFGSGKSRSGQTAIRVAKNRAAQNLQFIERYNDHTVFHNAYNKFHHTKIFIHKREDGSGLVCHRALKTICELIGIKNLHCKVEGNTGNIRALTHGFFEALRKQETHQGLADRSHMHVVEYSKQRLGVPYLVASPVDRMVATQELRDEEDDLEMAFSRLYYEGRVELEKPPKAWPYAKSRSYRLYKADIHRRRNQMNCRIRRLAGMG